MSSEEEVESRRRTLTDKGREYQCNIKRKLALDGEKKFRNAAPVKF